MQRPFDWPEFSRTWEEMSARLRNAKSIVSAARAASLNPQELMGGEIELANALHAAREEMHRAVDEAQKICSTDC